MAKNSDKVILSPGIIKETLRHLEKYLKKDKIVEICVNGPGEVFVEDVKGNWKIHKDTSITKLNMSRMIKNIANLTRQRFTEEYPIVSSYIPVENWGYRFQAAMGSAVADDGFMISIRIGNAMYFDMDSYFNEEDRLLEIKKKVYSKNPKEAVTEMMDHGENIIISGGTSTGKTTMLNSLMRYIPDDQRIICLENMKELSVKQRNNVRLLVSESRDNNGYELAMNCILKARPDRIIIGELTPKLSEYYIRLANTGHAGTCTTVHADGPSEALNAVYKNMLMAGSSESETLRKEVAHVVKYVIQCYRAEGRKITARLYKMGYKDGEYMSQEVKAS